MAGVMAGSVAAAAVNIPGAASATHVAARVSATAPAAVLPVAAAARAVSGAVAVTGTARVPAMVAVSSTVSSSAVGAPALTREQVLTVRPDDRVIGSMMAPVTIFEYASLTCSHCADFEKETLPRIKKDWIATGKVKYVMRDMPWDNLALGMSKVARCVPANQFEPLMETFYAQQMKIMMAKDPLAEIKNVAKMAGLSEAQVDMCIKDPNLHAKVTAMKDAAFNVLQVRGTPTFFINGTRVDGAVSYKDLKKTIEAEYAKAKR